jgi:nickel/cobalt transporter (NiCoT) family protein
MLTTSAFTVFVLGLRHGADPDHLAAIDNLTRNSIGRSPRLARFVGTLFAFGHTLMVLVIALFVGYLGSRFAAHSRLVESIGTWISILVLLLVAALNLSQLFRGAGDGPVGIKARLLPAAVRASASVWAAIPAGALFGFGFETSSQVAAYSLAFGADVIGALVIGSMFCLGMVCTDTLDSLFVHGLVAQRARQAPGPMRAWIATVALLAIAVALYELAQQLGWRPVLSELSVSAIMVCSLLAVFIWIYVVNRRSFAVDAYAIRDSG